MEKEPTEQVREAEKKIEDETKRLHDLENMAKIFQKPIKTKRTSFGEVHLMANGVIWLKCNSKEVQEKIFEQLK